MLNEHGAQKTFIYNVMTTMVYVPNRKFGENESNLSIFAAVVQQNL